MFLKSAKPNNFLKVTTRIFVFFEIVAVMIFSDSISDHKKKQKNISDFLSGHRTKKKTQFLILV